MSPERWQQIEEVFQAVVDLAPEDRLLYLNARHADDRELIEEIQKLIADYEDAGDFIESPVWTDSFMLGKTARGKIGDAISVEIRRDEDSLIGKRLGVYRLTGELGRGGMGAVYLAERDDGEFRQRVALKVIKRGMDTDFIVRRFRNERQILATLDHQNIARLLDGGTTDDGLPFFVMEYIEGKPVYQYCDAEKLNINERLQLFRQICFAVDYAHQNLIIHRDIKPSNILITDDGTPKLLDFGIAKILNPELAVDSIDPTATAMRMMTPEYASPEQVRGEAVAKTSDIYSLGVLLYELLTGHRPYRLNNRALHEIARVICEEEPENLSSSLTREDNLVPTSGGDEKTTLEFIFENRNASLETLRRELAGDLEKIVLKAMRKDPGERYGSAAEFAEDILYYLESRPVLAEDFYLNSLKITKSLPKSEPDQISVAVLPLKLLGTTVRGEDTGDEYLCIGLADALVTRLSNVRRLVVRPTSSVLHFNDSGVNPFEAGRRLDVTHLLEGSVRRVGDRIRVTVQLLNVSENSVVWAENFSEHLTDVLELEDSISEKVVKSLIPQLTGEEEKQLQKRGTNSAEAYEAYMRGRYYWNQFTPESLGKAREAFQTAIDLDGKYALAYVGLADFYIWGNIYGLIPSLEALELAESSARRAIELDDKLSEAYASLSLIAQNRKRWDEAEKIKQQAIALNPNYVHAHEWYAAQLVGLGRTDEGLREIRITERLDSLSLRTKTLVAWMLYQARQFEEALRHGRQIIDLDKNYPQGYSQIGLNLLALGNPEEALPYFQKFDELIPASALTKYQLCFALVANAQTDEARKTLSEIKTLASNGYVKPYFLGMAHVALGEYDEAFAYFERSFAEDEPWMIWFGTEPMLKGLHGDGRYQDLLRRMGNPLAKLPEVANAVVKPAGDKKSIAVLPFKILQISKSGDTEEEFLGIGLADALINRLSGVRRLIVRPTSSVIRFGAAGDPFEAAAELDVEYIVDGSLRRAGRRLRISIQLLSVAQKTAVWAKTFDENLTDVLALEDSISGQIAEALVIKLTGAERQRIVNRGTDNAQAYEAYLRGRFHWHSYTVESLAKSLVCFYEAIALDPNFAPAYSGVADYYNFLSIFGIMSPEESFPAAKEAAQKAVKLDQDLAEAYISLAVTALGFDWDFAKAEKHLKRALELNPNSAEAHVWRGHLYSVQGQNRRAVRELEVAERLNPQSPSLLVSAAIILRNARQYEKGVAKLRQALVVQPNNPTALSGFSWFVKPLGNFEETEEMCRRALELSDRQNLPMYSYGYTLAAGGKNAEAREIVEEMEARRAAQYVPPIQIALIYTELGDRDAAFKWLAKSFVEHDFWAIFLPVDGRFDSLKDDPRYEYYAGKIRPQTAEAGDDEIHQSHVATKIFSAAGVTAEPPENTKETVLPPKKEQIALKKVFAIAAGAILLIVLSFFAYRGLTGGNPKIIIVKQPDGKEDLVLTSDLPKKIAILPFKTDSHSAKEEELGVGLAESLYRKLGQIKELSVRPAMLNLRQEQTPKELGVSFGVNYILRGNLHNTGEQLQVSAELVDTHTEKILWAESFDENLNDFPNLQVSISDKVLKALTIELTTAERRQINKNYTNNSEAYQLYLAGRFLMGNRSAENLDKAIKTFEKSLEKDANFPLAYAGLADAYALLNLYQIPPPPDAYPKAKINAAKALELDGELAEAHASLGYILFYGERRRREAERELRRALELNPSYSTAYHWSGLVFAAMGKSDEAIGFINKALELEPRSAIVHSAAGLVYFYARRYDEALNFCRKALEINPGFVPAHKTMRVIYEATGNFEEAQNAYQKERIYAGNTDENEPGWLMITAQVLAVGGKSGVALNNLKRIEQTASTRDNPKAYGDEIAIAYALLGEKEKALEWLEKAKNASSHSFNFAAVDPRYDKIRDDARFVELTAIAE